MVAINGSGGKQDKGSRVLAQCEFQARNNAVKKFMVEFPGSMNVAIPVRITDNI